MSNQSIAKNQIKSDRYEIEPRPRAVGGGWRLRLYGKDLETGQEIEMGGAAFPVEDDQDEQDAYEEAMRTGFEWLQTVPNDQGATHASR